MKKEEILGRLFSSKWNYAWGKVDKHVISLFYEKEGLKGLRDYIFTEQQRLKDFSNYYSKDLLETLNLAVKELNDKDFEDYIDNNYLEYNKENLKKLKTI